MALRLATESCKNLLICAVTWGAHRGKKPEKDEKPLAWRPHNAETIDARTVVWKKIIAEG
jgi:hypothetical protein